MSVSSHLSPEPERRLWIIHGNLHRSIERTDLKLWALTAFSAAQMVLVAVVVPGGPFSRPALALLAAVLPLGLFALSSFVEVQRQFPFLDPRMDKR